MLPSFKESNDYLNLDAATQALVDALIDAQNALGEGDFAVLPYGDPLTIETRSATYEEVCPPPSTDCGENPLATIIAKRDDTDEDSTCK